MNSYRTKLRCAIGALGRSRRRQGSAGQALVELALVTPIMLILLLAAIDLGRIYYAQITVANAARSGAYEYSTSLASTGTTPTYVAGAGCPTPVKGAGSLNLVQGGRRLRRPVSPSGGCASG